MKSEILLPTHLYWDPSLQLGEETEQLTRSLWPNYLIESSDIPDTSLTLEIDEAELARRFPCLGIREVGSHRLRAYLSAVLIHAEDSTQLPPSGWEFAMRSVCSNAEPNCLCLLAANVDPECKNLGLGSLLLLAAKELARELGFPRLIAPVRPNRKHEFPWLSMLEYLAKKSPDHAIFDPWLRAHQEAGADILNVCDKSVCIKASLQKWTEWTGQGFANSGEYLLPFGLMPLEADISTNIGTYREPNIWVRYQVELP